jgi:hypothetical protein
MQQATKDRVGEEPLRIEGELVLVTGRPDVGRVTISLGESCEITIAAEDASQFALLLYHVASTVHREHLGAAASQSAPARPVSERVM